MLTRHSPIASPFSERLVRTRKALTSQIAPRILPIYTPVIHPKLKRLLGEVLEISQGPALDMAEKLHRFGTGQVSEQLMGQPLDEETVALLAENETNICEFPYNEIDFRVRQRTIGSPLRDYVPALSAALRVRYAIGRILGIQTWAHDEKTEKAREFRRLQQSYISKMIGDLKARVAAGDQTPSILGNIFREGTLKEEEILLAAYTGSMSCSPTPYSQLKAPSSNDITRRSRCRCQPGLLADLDYRVPRQPARPSAERVRGYPAGV
jgi:phenylacetate 2-hydroxylase